jgi:hypothetical protein
MRPTRLGTEQQIAAEKLALRILERSEVRAAMTFARAQMSSNRDAQDPEGRESLERALKIWVHAFALRQTNGDTARPKVIADADSGAHEWFDHVYPSAQVAADNPDNVYRNVYIDGRSRYLLRGRITDPRPTQFVIELTLGRPGSLIVQSGGKDRIDLGGQLAILTDRTVKPDDDGRFVVSIDSDPQGDRIHHLRCGSGPQVVLLRDTLGDWGQSPLEYSIDRVDDAPAAPSPTEELIAAETAKDLPAWIAFWTQFKENWMGSPTPNTIARPAARDGGWGFGAAGRFELADDEAIVATVTDGNAAYTGIQIIDRWLIARDPRLDFVCLNRSQSKLNPDGSASYVISRDDPGFENWASTGGQHKGYIFLRWQGTPAGVDPAALIREFRLVKLDDLAGALRMTSLKRLSIDERERLRARRKVEYEARFRI